MSLRTNLKNISTNALKAFARFDKKTNGWLSPLLSIPLALSFKAATVLETKVDRQKRLADSRDNELLYGIRKMIYNPVYTFGTSETRQNHLRNFEGDEGTYTVQEMMNYIDSDFSKIWGSALIFGNRSQNLDFIAHHALRKTDNPNDKGSLQKTLKTLMDNPDTFGHEVETTNQITVEDAFERIEKINNERDNKIEKLAAKALFTHGLGVGFSSYEQVKKDMLSKGANDWIQRYDITPEEILDYAIDNADNIIDTKYADMGDKTKHNLKAGMSMLKDQRDGTTTALTYTQHEI